jgi:hypothetical protein
VSGDDEWVCKLLGPFGIVRVRFKLGGLWCISFSFGARGLVVPDSAAFVVVVVFFFRKGLNFIKTVRLQTTL